MPHERAPTRLGLPAALLPRYERLGWLEGELVAEAAAPLLRRLRDGPDPDGAFERLAALLERDPELARRVCADDVLGRALTALAGASRALMQALTVQPGLVAALTAPEPAPAELGDGDHRQRVGGLRRFVQRRLLRIAARDLLGEIDMPAVGRELSDTADAAAQAALTITDQQLRDGHRYQQLPPIPFTVIAMGKWGGAELNYSSDIDLLFVYDPPDQVDPEQARDYANRAAAAFIAVLSQPTPDGTAYRVDPDLRPEGKNGPLARSLDSYRAYYQRWAETWEFQALLKARPAAGDPHLGQRFLDLIAPHVYPETLDPAAIRAIRAMKARIEAERIPPGEDPDFHLKLGRGAQLDVEFSIQLLQLRHAGKEPGLRVQGTRPAVAAAAAAGLLTTAEQEALLGAYDFCAAVRNRLFLQLGRPSDSLPTDPEETVRLALSLGYLDAPRAQLREDYRRVTRRARQVVESRFFR